MILTRELRVGALLSVKTSLYRAVRASAESSDSYQETRYSAMRCEKTPIDKRTGRYPYPPEGSSVAGAGGRVPWRG